jgi:biopolymer transport protein ExbD
MIKRFMKRKADDPGNSASLNDLSFILIIFFIAIAGFNVNKGFLLDLPDASRPRVVQSDDLMKCRVESDGSLTLDGAPATIDALKASVAEKRGKNPNMTFLLTISPDAAWQSVVNVIHEIRLLDVDNFSFRMEGGSQ